MNTLEAAIIGQLLHTGSAQKQEGLPMRLWKRLDHDVAGVVRIEDEAGADVLGALRATAP